MAKTYLAGEAAVKLIPNAKGFHHQARRDLKAQDLNVGVDLKVANIGEFRRDARSKLKTVTGLKVEVTPDFNITGFRKKAQARLDAGRNLKVKVEVMAEPDRASITASRAAMQAQLDAMRPLSMRVELNTTFATHHMEAWVLAAEARRVNITVNADTTEASAAMKRMRMENGRGSGQGNSSKRSKPLYRKVRTAAIGTGIVLAPIATQAVVGGLTAVTAAASQAGGVLGMLPAVATAVGAGFAALGVGLFGVVGAFQALSKESESVTDAADNTRALASAARAVAGAERGLDKAQRGVARAQEDLNKARKQAVRDLRDMNDELRLAPLNEKEAALAIKEAQKRLSEAYASGDTLDIQGAQIDVEQSKIQYDILIKKNQDLYNDTMAANKAGVEGAEEVVAAKEGIVDANDAVLDAQDSLVAALEAQTEALKGNKEAADEAAKAMAKLSPNAQAFVLAMRALGPQWTELRKAVQDNLFGNLGDQVTGLANAQLPTLQAGLSGIAAMLNRGFGDSIELFSEEDSVNDFNTTLGNTQLLFAGLADTARPLSQAWINLSTVGSMFLPRMGLYMADVSTRFGEWTDRMRTVNSETGKSPMYAFFERSIEAAKQLGRILSNVGHIIGDVFSAGQETGNGMLATWESSTRALRDFTESVEGQTALKDFFAGVSQATATLMPILTIVAKTIIDTIGPALTDFVTGFGPGFVVFFENLRTGLQGVAPMMMPLGTALGGLVETLSPLLVPLGEVIGLIGTKLAEAIIFATPYVQMFVDYLMGHQEVLQIVAMVIAGIAGAFLAFSAVSTVLGPVMGIVGVFSKVAGVLSPIIGIVKQVIFMFGGLRPILGLLMGPVGIIIGLFTLLMATNEQFRDAVFEVIQILMDLVMNIVSQLMPVFMALVDAIMPLVDVLLTVFMEILNQVISAILPPFMEIVRALVPVVMALVDAIATAALALMPLITFLVQLVVAILPPFINILLAILIPVIKVLAEIIAWAFKLAADIIIWAINTVIIPLLNLITWAIQGVIDIVMWLWEKAFEPALKGIGNALQWVWDKIIMPVFNAIKDGIGSVGAVFSDIVEGIGKVWAKLGEYAAKPIVFVIDKVINGALKTGWNALAGIIPGLDEWDGVDIGTIKSFVGAAVPFFADGGYVRGPGGPREDKIAARLSNGEYVMKAAAVNRIGVDNLDRMNSGGDGDLRRNAAVNYNGQYADGGIVQSGAYLTTEIQRSMWDAVRTAFPNAQLSSGTRTEDVGSGYDNHMAGRAIDLGGPVGNLPEQARWIQQTYGPSILELIHWPLQGFENIKNGSPLNYGESTNSQHMDHVHWAMQSMVSSDGKVVSQGSDDGGGGGVFGWFREKLANKVADLLEKPLNAVGNAIPDFGGSKIGSIPKSWFNSIKDSALSFIREKIGGASASGAAANMAPGVGPVVDQVREAMKAYGWDSGPQWDALDQLISHESSWNPLARNPSSGAFGLGQFLGATKDAYLPDENPNPGIQAHAMARYITDRYGDPISAWNFWQNPQPNPYGGNWYDQGGIANGIGVMAKNTLEPERVLSPQQTAAFEMLVPLLGFLLPALGALGGDISPKPTAVNVTQVNGQDLAGADMPVTADVEGRDVTTGVAYGQPLQGAAIDNETGEYLPGQNTSTVATEDLKVPFQFKTDTPEWKATKSIGGKLGFGNILSKAESKAAPLNTLIGGATAAAPAYAAALAGDPTQLAANIATSTANWAEKTTTDFSKFVPENAGDMIESGLSALTGPLIGTVNTGMSRSELVSTMEDVENRKARRSKTGRSRRG